MTDDDALVLAALQAEFADGVEFLASKGHSGARLETAHLHGFESMIVELEVPSPDGLNAQCWVEIDPCRVGWRLDASIAEHGYGAAETHDREVGYHRVISPTDAQSAARVLARAAYVALWEHLESLRRP